MPAPSVPPGPARSLELPVGELEVDAGLLEIFRPQQRVRASDGVEIRMGERTLLAQEATVDLTSSRLTIDGPFRLLSPQSVITGERAELELEPLAGIIYRGTLVTSGGRLHLVAAQIRRDADGNYVLLDSELTTCDCAPGVAGLEDSRLKRFLARPSWSVGAHRVVLTWEAAGPATTTGNSLTPPDRQASPEPPALPARTGSGSLTAPDSMTPAPSRDASPALSQDALPASSRDGSSAPSRDASPAPSRDTSPASSQDGSPTPSRDDSPASSRDGLSASSQAASAATGRVTLEGATLRLKGLPVFYLPRGAFPVGRERVSGLLAPELRQNQDGVIFRLPYYFVTGPHSDLTLGLTANQSRGLRPDLEYRYLLGPEAGGQLNAAWMYDFERAGAGLEPSRWALRWKHRSDPGSTLRWVADLNEVSDPDYVRDFGGELETRSGEYLATQARAEVRGARGGASLGLEHFTELQSGLGARTVGRLPELRGDVRGPAWNGAWGTLRLRGDGEAFYQAALPGWGETEGDAAAPPASLPPGRLYALARPSLAWARPFGRWGSMTGGLEYAGTLELEERGGDAEAGSSAGRTAATGIVPPADTIMAAQQVMTGRLELSTALVRTFKRPGHSLEKLQHRIEPSIRVQEDFWYSQGADYLAPVGEAAGRVQRVTAEVTQRLWARQAAASGGGLVELGTFKLALGQDLAAGGRLTDVGAELELHGPVTLRLTGLVDPYSGRPVWVQGRTRYAFGPGWLEAGYGWLDSTQTARPPDGPALVLPEASELTLGAGVTPGELLGSWGGRQWWLRGWRIEALTRLGLVSGVTPYTRRLSLRYDSPCHCFSAQLFVALDRDRTFPEVKARVLPSPIELEPGGWERP